MSCNYLLFIINYLWHRCSSSSVSWFILTNNLFVSFPNRVKLHHFESVHDQLLSVDSHQLNAFERKYGLGGPIPEGLTNYLDVIQNKMFFILINIFLFLRLNIMVILVLVHPLKLFVLYSSMIFLIRKQLDWFFSLIVLVHLIFGYQGRSLFTIKTQCLYLWF